MIKKDLTGKIFNYLKVIKFSRYSASHFYKGKNKGKRKYWLCECLKCGNLTEQREDSLLNGHSKSCGCLQKEKATKHGQWRRDESLFYRYIEIIQRCYNKKNNSYINYGGRGIKVCQEWKNNPKLFIDWAYENGYKKELTIDRIDVNGDYCPDNCRWVSKLIQGQNKRNNRIIIYNKEKYCVAAICRKLSLPINSIRRKSLKENISYQEAFDSILREKNENNFNCDDNGNCVSC